MLKQSHRNSLYNLKIFSVLQSHGINYPTPANLNYFWGFGFLAIVCLVLQILTGVLLAMHYTANTELAFLSVESIMRDVQSG